MSRFCKVGNRGRIFLLERPAGPHSLNACSPDVCLSLILLKESVISSEAYVEQMRKMGHPRPLLPLTCLILTQDFCIQLHNLSLSSDHNETGGRRDRRGSCFSDTLHAAPLPFILCFQLLEVYVLSMTLETFL